MEHLTFAMDRFIFDFVAPDGPQEYFSQGQITNSEDFFIRLVQYNLQVADLPLSEKKPSAALYLPEITTNISSYLQGMRLAGRAAFADVEVYCSFPSIEKVEKKFSYNQNKQQFYSALERLNKAKSPLEVIRVAPSFFVQGVSEMAESGMVFGDIVDYLEDKFAEQIHLAQRYVLAESATGTLNPNLQTVNDTFFYDWKD